MPFLIGTDEAGYGPNLGPLVITGTLWKVPDLTTDLYQLLKSSVAKTSAKNRIKVCDSKSLYQSGGSIEALETSVFSLLEISPVNWRSLVEFLGCAICGNQEPSWLSNGRLELPMRAEPERVDTLRDRFLKSCEKPGVELVSIQTKTLFADQFNESVSVQGNKATVLSATTLGLVNELLERVKGDSVRIICDKHGGRSKYAGLLQHVLTDQLVEVVTESLETSRYRWKEGEREFQVEFNARGEGDLPVALASMVSKYVREVYMKLWNQFWLEHLPSLKPTKGYPQDAKRFMSEIESVRSRLKISRESLWRCR